MFELYVVKSVSLIFNFVVLPYVAQLCEKLLVDYPEKIGNKTEPLLKAVIYSVLYPTAPTRKSCQSIVKNMVSSKDGDKIAITLLKQLDFLLDSDKINFANDGDNAIATTPHAVVEFITSVCSTTTWSSEDAQSVAIAALLPAHYPLVVNLAPELWVKIAKHLNCNPKHLVAQRASHLTKLLVEEYKSSQVCTSLRY